MQMSDEKIVGPDIRVVGDKFSRDQLIHLLADSSVSACSRNALT